MSINSKRSIRQKGMTLILCLIFIISSTGNVGAYALACGARYAVNGSYISDVKYREKKANLIASADACMAKTGDSFSIEEYNKIDAEARTYLTESDYEDFFRNHMMNDKSQVAYDKAVNDLYNAIQTSTAINSVLSAVSGESDDPDEEINNLSIELTSIVKGVGIMALLWGVVEFGFSVSQRDGHQRNTALLFLVSGLIIYYFPEILSMF